MAWYNPSTWRNRVPQTGRELDPRNIPQTGVTPKELQNIPKGVSTPQENVNALNTGSSGGKSGGSSGNRSGGGGSSSNNVSQNVNAVNSSKSTPEQETTQNIANNIKAQLLSDYPKLESSRNVNALATMLATGKIDNYGGKKYGYISDNPAVASAVNRFDNFNVLANKAQTNYNKKNTVTILTNENNKVTGVEYGGQSFDPKGFEKSFGVKVLTNPKDGSFFFGTTGTPETKKLSTISGDFKPITMEEKAKVKQSLAEAKMVSIATGKIITDSKLAKYLSKEGNWAYDKITSATTNKLSEYARKANDSAVYILNQSDFNYGNKVANITSKTIGRVLYVGGTSTSFALNMISGFGNLALKLALKPKEGAKEAVMLFAPSAIKAQLAQIGKTAYGRGDIYDFYSSALTLATVAQTASSFAKFGSSLKNVKMTRQLKKDLPAIKIFTKQTEKLLRTELNGFQRVFMKNSRKWDTFGKALQEIKGSNARHLWKASTSGKKTVIIQASEITTGNVKMINIMSAQSTASRLTKFVVGMKDRFGNRFSFGEYFKNNKKVGTYLSKIKARREYTFIQKRNSPITIAVDGRGNTFLLKNPQDLANFFKKSKFGKMHFTGRIGIGGNIDITRMLAKKGNKAIGFSTGKTNRFGSSNSRALTLVERLENKIKDSTAVKSIKYSGGKKTPFSKTFGNQAQELVQKQVNLPRSVSLSRAVSGSVVSSQLKTATRAISKVIAKNDLALKSGFRAVVGSNGLMFFNQSGKLVSARDATKLSDRSIDRVNNGVRDIIKDNTIQSPRINTSQSSSFKSGQAFASGSASAVNSAQGSSQASSQKSAQKSQQTQRSGQTSRSSTGSRVVTQMTPKFKFALPEYKRKQKIVKSILGNKLAPSYQIYIGSGKKVKKLGGRYSPKEAISKGTYTIDRTKERTIRIVPTKQKPNARFKMDYLQKASTKFRNYRIRQGKRVRYSSTRLIEKSKYFNDLEKFRRKRK